MFNTISQPLKGAFSRLMLQHVRRVIAAGAALYRLGSTGPAGRAHFRGVHARPPHHHHHHAEGILPFIHFLMRSNETVFGRVPELRVLAAASLRLTRLQTAARPPTIRPSRPGPPPPPHFCATGLAEFIPEQPPRGQIARESSAVPGFTERPLGENRRKAARCSRSSSACAHSLSHSFLEFPLGTTLMRKESSKRQSETQMVFDVWVMI